MEKLSKLVNNKYQRKSEISYNFMPSKCYAYLLNVETRNLVFLKICDTELYEIIINLLIKMVNC